MEEKVRKTPAPKPKRQKAAKKRPKKLRKGIFRLDFKKGEESLPPEISGPIVGMFPRTQHSYEIIWLEDE